MSIPATESDGGILDAGTASAEDVAAALGVDPQGDDGEPDDVPGEEQEGSEDDSLAAVVAEMRIEIARLKRENAAARVASKKVATAEPDQDATVTAAVEAAKAEAKLEYGVKLAGSEIKASLAAVMTDAQLVAFVDDLNLAKYVTEDGEPDAEAIKALQGRQLALLGKRPAAKVGHGRTGPAGSKSNSDLFADAFNKALNTQ